MVLCLIMETIATGIPEALYRIRTLDGVRGYSPVGVMGIKVLIENCFRAFHRAKMNSQDT